MSTEHTGVNMKQQLHEFLLNTGWTLGDKEGGWWEDYVMKDRDGYTILKISVFPDGHKLVIYTPLNTKGYHPENFELAAKWIGRQLVDMYIKDWDE